MTDIQGVLFGLSAVIAALVAAYIFHLKQLVKQKVLDCRVAANKSLSSFIILVIIFITLHYILSILEKNSMPGYVYIATFIMLSIGLISYMYLFSMHYQNSNDDLLKKLNEIESILKELNSKTGSPGGPGSGGANVTPLNSSANQAGRCTV